MILESDYLDFVITVVDTINGAAYLFDKSSDVDDQHWRANLKLEQFRSFYKKEAPDHNKN